MYQVDFNHPIHVYFIGIGGISMSGLAEILLSEGFTVSGSDWNRSALTEHLEKSGAHVNYGKPQKAENITDDIDLVVYTAAVHADNQEFSRAKELHLDEKFYETTDIHIHLPEGAIPKDGPSAGITMVTAMVSALTKRCIKAGIAMTGEITLSGKVLPVGGIKEKMLAAHRYGVKTILLPEQNMQDLEELPVNVRAAIKFIPVNHMDQVLKLALEE